MFIYIPVNFLNTPSKTNVKLKKSKIGKVYRPTDRQTDRQTDRRRTKGDQKSSLELSAQVT